MGMTVSYGTVTKHYSKGLTNPGLFQPPRSHPLPTLGPIASQIVRQFFHTRRALRM